MSEVLAKTTLGNSIELHKFGPAGKPVLLLVGGVHGDEPEGIWLVEEFMKAARQEHMSWNCQVWVIPVLNPDGATRGERTNGRGVDLNRNFPAPDWTREARAPRYYPGDHPASEVETQALMTIIQEAHPFLLIHCHSWNPQICYTGAAARPWAEILSHGTGYPATPDIGYPTPGSIGQFGWYGNKTPVICIEMREGDPRAEVIRRGIEPLLNTVRKGFMDFSQ